MTINDYPEINRSPKREVGLLTIFRLGLFNMALGLMAVLTLAVLNRVMISELGIPATITAGVLALSQFIAPARVWFGQLSDSKPLFGRYRTGYIRLGAVIFSFAVFLAVQAVWQLGAITRDNGGWSWDLPTIGWASILGLIMVIYGLAVSASSTPFTALLVDISDTENRSKLVAIVWSMLMVGIVIGGISGSILLKRINPGGIEAGQIPLENLQAPINSIFAIVPFVVIALTLIATWGVEKKYSRFSDRNNNETREDSITLSESLKVLTSSRQTGIFFSFLCLITISLFMQEAVLEPYGGEVFGMSIADTTQLNANWGVGILIGYSLTGFLIAPRLGKKLTTRMGCLLVAASFGLIILSGLTQEENILRLAVVLFGAAAGMATIGSISLMLDFTLAETAGTFIGAWGLAQAMSRAFATLIGGIVLDITRAIFTIPLIAYGSVFALQALGMIVAVIILNRIDIKEFQENTGQAIATVMEGDLDS
ncbi:PUCC protein [Xenococcus sp. PCC 7305]|uniref:BCD family MFS transporter n=1 Tax=Xenococcus sp. PCC 7305 TaxID=102125 RepID=UPI0002AC4CCC|nr:BCD family MFS transporter [Xenococcus sp. PCC 7305]ELS02615.1 PUCC protein [Xenococcus sp. PCC 7305]